MNKAQHTVDVLFLDQEGTKETIGIQHKNCKLVRIIELELKIYKLGFKVDLLLWNLPQGSLNRMNEKL